MSKLAPKIQRPDIKAALKTAGFDVTHVGEQGRHMTVKLRAADVSDETYKRIVAVVLPMCNGEYMVILQWAVAFDSTTPITNSGEAS